MNEGQKQEINLLKDDCVSLNTFFTLVLLKEYSNSKKQLH